MATQIKDIFNPEFYERTCLERVLVQDIVRENLVCIPDNASMREAASILTKNKISGAPVVNDDQQYIGVLSASDIVRYHRDEPSSMLTEAEYYRTSESLHAKEVNIDYDFQLETLTERPITEIMTPTIHAVDASLNMSTLLETMTDMNLHRIFVTRHGEVIGLVTSMDILYAVNHFLSRNVE